MPPSQLKRLKQSLRDQGITGPQQSKKQKKQNHGSTDKRVQRDAALQQIRDSFNPFEIKAPARNAKFASMSDKAAPKSLERPGVTKSLGEKLRRQNLLPELQRRNKSGGIIDRRIGEDDATLTPEERALQRFVREKSRRKNGSMFDLEGDDDEGSGLTHLGKSLSFGDGDDFDAGSLAGSDDDSERGDSLLKRRREPASDEELEAEAEEVEGDDDEPARKKTKQEVMKEVIAKSKLHKYERQKAKEDDDELREKLDSEMGDMLSLLMGRKVDPPKSNGFDKEPAMNADRLAMLQGKSREVANKEYDTRLRQMAQDQRAAPADRTKTEEEKAKVEADRLKKLEENRQKRMRGEEESDVSGDEKEKLARGVAEPGPEDEEEEQDDAAEFGLSAPDKKVSRTKMPTLDDEDEFELDDELIASESEEGSEVYNSAEDSDDSDDEDAEPNGRADHREDEEDEFVKGILDSIPGGDDKKMQPQQPATGIAFTYACPRSHEELLEVFKSVKDSDIPLVIQRIRGLYHSSLSAENKEKLADFSNALVEHLTYLGTHNGSLQTIEIITRHLHSLSRTYPEQIGTSFRECLRSMHERDDINAGDLVILTAIGSIYPTSDHFHQVATPAIVLMAKWLGMTSPTSKTQLIIGANVVLLVLHYQRLSKRYMPEALRFTLKAIQTPADDSVLKAHLTNLNTMAEQYRNLPAFAEIFHAGVLSAVSKAKDTKTLQHLHILLSQARLARRPLLLHNHKPLPIRMSVPKFEESFAPGKHYDPDKDRSDAAKLRKEYKRERKGAVRELRKDANFMAREQLREKKEADKAYEKKFRRLVAEINSEEGREGNQYAREKERRKRAK